MATAITKSSSGPPTRHILASHGPSIYPLDFYSTTYSIQHGRHKACPSSTNLRHKGTGYTANFRPTIYYNRQADLTDNPSIANLLGNVYGTSASRDYRPQQLKTGYEPLPSSIRQGPSGYTHNLPITRALYQHRASSDTIYRGEYPSKKFRDGTLDHNNHSNKEKSGFSHSVNIEPVTYRPNECHSGDIPGEITWRPTGQTLMKRDFVRTLPLTGHESLPVTSVRASQSNGYIKGNSYPAKAHPSDIKEPTIQELHHKVAQTKRKCDPALFSTITHPFKYTAYTGVIYTPQGIHPYTNKISNMGKQELSGYSDNTLPHFTPTEAVYYNTSSGDNYSNPAIPQLQSTDTPRSTLPDGFTKSTRLHSHGCDYKPAQTLRNQHPYVAKSILAQDPCFVDLTYQNKRRLSK